MEKRKTELVYHTLLDALKKDRSKTNVMPISGLGLVEMTRKRTRDTLTRVLCTGCSYCEGTGRVKSVSTVCYELVRELFKILSKASGKKVSIYAHPEVTASLADNGQNMIEKLEDRFGKSLSNSL